MYPLRPPTPNSSRPLNFPLIINCAQEVGGAKQGASIELITCHGSLLAPHTLNHD